MADSPWKDYDKEDTAGQPSKKKAASAWEDYNKDAKNKGQPVNEGWQEIKNYFEPTRKKISDFNKNYIDPYVEPFLGKTTREDFQKAHAGFQTSMAKGVPIARHLLPDNPYQTEYERLNPGKAQLGEMTGSLVSTAPVMGGVTAKVGSGFLPQIFGQGGAGAVTGAADELTRQGGLYNGMDVGKQAMKEAGLRVLGVGMGKAISPGKPDPQRYKAIEEALKETGYKLDKPINQAIYKSLLTNQDPRVEYALHAAGKVPMPTGPEILHKVGEKFNEKFGTGISLATLAELMNPTGIHGVNAMLGFGAPFAKEAVTKGVPIWWHNRALIDNPGIRYLTEATPSAFEKLIK